ncbi:hypothetical protein FVE85_8656 [Porphyridium purpureum]|uniref:Uncharacterized protein n=1 Tax=Porphyridium purpureum TaxID=35688 RepID=A0A5J4YNW1_PORPP|nr:hypothetical protein FVE85_8656 [Porphyridium purpureum]|eukprot:POR9825..scf296_7
MRSSITHRLSVILKSGDYACQSRSCTFSSFMKFLTRRLVCTGALSYITNHIRAHQLAVTVQHIVIPKHGNIFCSCKCSLHKMQVILSCCRNSNPNHASAAARTSRLNVWNVCGALKPPFLVETTWPVQIEPRLVSEHDCGPICLFQLMVPGPGQPLELAIECQWRTSWNFAVCMRDTHCFPDCRQTLDCFSSTNSQSCLKLTSRVSGPKLSNVVNLHFDRLRQLPSVHIGIILAVVVSSRQIAETHVLRARNVGSQMVLTLLPDSRRP